MAFRIVIYGQVHGVGYRRWLQREAQAAGVCGWCRNRADSTVEALLDGPAAAVRDLIRRCHEGPSLASVDRVDVREETTDVPVSGTFSVEHSA